jgi:hypothetical protein
MKESCPAALQQVTRPPIPQGHNDPAALAAGMSSVRLGRAFSRRKSLKFAYFGRFWQFAAHQNVL